MAAEVFKWTDEAEKDINDDLKLENPLVSMLYTNKFQRCKG